MPPFEAFTLVRLPREIIGPRGSATCIEYHKKSNSHFITVIAAMPPLKTVRPCHQQSTPRGKDNPTEKDDSAPKRSVHHPKIQPGHKMARTYRSGVKPNLTRWMDEDPFSSGFYRTQAHREAESNNRLNGSVRFPFSGDNEWVPTSPEFPWDLQLPPCQRRISSFTELDEYMNAVPALAEPYKLTYYPWSSDRERLTDPHRKLG